MRSSDKRAEQFLSISDQFKLGVLTTESSHPITAALGEVAQSSISDALGLLFDADGDVVEKYREWAESGAAEGIKETVLRSLRNGGRIFFTGCGSTGRLSIQLDSIWQDFWQRQVSITGDWEERTFSVMAGGDFALIKSVEGFEDYTEFGRKQINDLGVDERDVVFAITEGGETSFVIGTAWQALDKGAKVYFVYNNPDDILREHVERSRQVIDEPRIEKINLTTGPMAITGSTRMQATTIQLCVMLTILEMVARDLVSGPPSSTVPLEFARRLAQMHATLNSEAVRSRLAELVAMEEQVYRCGHINNYFADRLGIDVLTDTTERSPTYCVPPFKKRDGSPASESWSFLFLPDDDTERAWQRILKREARCVEWSEPDVREMVGDDKAQRQYEIVRRISRDELMKFKIGLDGLRYRPLGPGDSAVGIAVDMEIDSLRSGFHRTCLDAAHKAGASVGLIFLGNPQSVQEATRVLDEWRAVDVPVLVEVPETDFLLDGITRAGAKMLLNALSTCTMVRLGRVMGNYMIYVVPSNLKLIDRATRYISQLTDLSYEDACHLLFEVIEYVEPRMKADQAYPPVVGMAVTRARDGIGNEEAEEKINL